MMLWDQTLTEIFHRGSFVMWPLFFCSVMGVAVIFERTLYFIKLRFSEKTFREKLFALLKREEIVEAQKYCRTVGHPVPRLAGTYLKNVSCDELRADLVKRDGSLALKKVEKNFRVLSAITHIAPLLGLLGTVTGLVSAFHQIELLGGSVQPSDLAGGIWEALLTTVFGLMIAIPCMAFHHVFESFADDICLRMKTLIIDLDEFFKKKTNGEELTPLAKHEESVLEGVH